MAKIEYPTPADVAEMVKVLNRVGYWADRGIVTLQEMIDEATKVCNQIAAKLPDGV